MRECGSCTLCCKLLELHEIPSKIGTYCEQCEPTIGCKIHDNLPKECEVYQCMWSQMETVSDALRPDRCGVIFGRTSEDVITARLEEGKKLNDLTYGQVNFFIKEGFSVLIFRGREMKFFLNDKHTQEYVLEKVNGRSKLY